MWIWFTRRSLLHWVFQKCWANTEIVQEMQIGLLHSSSARKPWLSLLHSIDPCVSLDIGNFVRRGELACEVHCLWGSVSLRFKHRQKLLSHHLPVNSEIETFSQTSFLHSKVNKKIWENSWLKDMPVHIKIFANWKYIVPLCCQLWLWLTSNVSWLQIEFSGW